MSTTIGLAREAFDAYRRGEHQQCQKHLEQVQTQKSGDVKIAHNVAVNAYFASGCADPHDLLTRLTQHYDRAREQEKKDKGKRKKEEEEDALREDNDLYVLRYNQALLCVQVRNYAQARHILEELFDNIEPIDDFLAIKICFLLLELCLLQREPEQGVPVLTSLEKPNAFHSLLKPEKPDRGPKSLEARVEEEEEGEEGQVREDPEPKEDPPVAELEAKVEKEDVTGPLPSLVFGAFLLKHGRAPDTISPAEFKFNCLVYRVRINLALRKLSSAKKDCKKAMDLLDHDLNSVPLLWPHSLTDTDDMQKDPVRQMLTSHEKANVEMLKAYLEYAKGNFRKALKLMSLCRFNFAAGAAVSAGGDDEDQIPDPDFHPAQDDACSPLYFNNMGCVHFMMHKPNLAAYYFSKALSKSLSLPTPAKGNGQVADKAALISSRTGLSEPGHAASMHWLDRRAEITFNVGLQFLLTGRSGQASKCFEQCVPVFRNWPRLWIRIAECCIELYRQSHKSEKKESKEGKVEPSTQGFQSWNRTKANGLVPSGGSLCDALGPTAVGSGVSKLACGAQGFGIHRRVLLMVDKSNMVGKLSGEDVERTGPAGAPPPVGSRNDEVVSDPLVAAAMCLKNVLILVESQLRADADGGSARSPSSKPASEQMAGELSDGARTHGHHGTRGTVKNKLESSHLLSWNKNHRNRQIGLPFFSGFFVRKFVLYINKAEMEANLLEDAALLKLAWVCLGALAFPLMFTPGTGDLVTVVINGADIGVWDDVFFFSPVTFNLGR